MDVFANRIDAGRRLGQRLLHLRDSNPIVLGVPRGGVPVAAEVAKLLDAPLDVIVVRKLGMPTHPEVAMGAIGEGGARLINADVKAMAQVSDIQLDVVEQRERAVLDDRVALLRRGRERIEVAGRTVVVVDDGIATGATSRVACQVARQLGAARVILAAPVGAADTVNGLVDADEVVCAVIPPHFIAVGYHYRDFSPTSDSEVVSLLDAAAWRTHLGLSSLGLDRDLTVIIPVGDASLEGHLHLPDPVSGVVVFAHGSGSSRRSRRNRFVAAALNEVGLGTLLLDLLTPTEEKDRTNVFDVDLLAHRLVLATRWLTSQPSPSTFRVGFFGASTGAGAALVAAAELGNEISAVVSRGGRPDLAGAALPRVTAPTLLIVGGNDQTVLEHNIHAQAQLTCPNTLEIIEGATHLFEEPGALASVALLARDWFARQLLRQHPAEGSRNAEL